MSLPFKIDELLKNHADDRAALEEFARPCGRTIDECVEWLEARGYRVSRGAVGNWLRKFRATDRLRAAAEVAGAVMSAKANEAGSVSLADAANVKLHQLLLEKLIEIEAADGEEAGEGVSTGELLDLANALRSGAATKQQVEDLKRVQREAVAAAERDAKAGASGEAVVSKVKELLGL